MAKSKTALTTILGQLPTARAVAKREKDEGRRAIGAHYDRRTQRILVELTSGFLFGFPAASIPELAHAPIEQRARVTVSSGGGALHWPGLDVDLSVPGLLLASVGRKERLLELARFAGQSSSPAKAAAARANGAKGGRPKKAVAR
ncbi:MAG: DUF2442 domain-containing protein [bacterium]|jgi:hypothetical protein